MRFTVHLKRFHPLGLRLSHWRQWLEVLAEEGRSRSWWSILRAILPTLSQGTVSRREYRRRLRACRRCVLWDATLRRCRPLSGSPLGCGCYMPLKAAAKKARCWLKQAGVNELGWD